MINLIIPIIILVVVIALIGIITDDRR